MWRFYPLEGLILSGDAKLSIGALPGVVSALLSPGRPTNLSRLSRTGLSLLYHQVHALEDLAPLWVTRLSRPCHCATLIT
jgi:hypothetical protein